MTKKVTGGGTESKDLAEHIMAYVPSEVISLFIPISAGIATSVIVIGEWRFLVALALGALTALYVGSTAVTAAPPATGITRASVVEALKNAWFEVVAGGIAAFAWASVLPSTWIAYPEAWMPGALIAVVAVLIGIVGRFVSPLRA